MGNVVGRRVPDRNAQQFGGTNPFGGVPAPTGVEAGGKAEGTGYIPTGTVVEEGGMAAQQQQQQQQPQGWTQNQERPKWSDLTPMQQLAAVLMGIVGSLIFIYPLMTLILSSIECPDEFFLVPYFGFLTGVSLLFCISASSYAGPARGAILALMPLVFFSLPSIFMYASGFGEGCQFLGVENGFLLFFPVLTGTFMLIFCTLGRGLNEALGGPPVINLSGNTQRGAWGIQNQQVVQGGGRGWN